MESADISCDLEWEALQMQCAEHLMCNAERFAPELEDTFLSARYDKALREAVEVAANAAGQTRTAVDAAARGSHSLRRQSSRRVQHWSGHPVNIAVQREQDDSDPGGTLQALVSMLSQAQGGCPQLPQAAVSGPCRREALEAGYEIAAAGMADAMKRRGGPAEESQAAGPKRARRNESGVDSLPRDVARAANRPEKESGGTITQHARLQQWLDDCIHSVIPSEGKYCCPSLTAEIPLEEMAVPTLTDFAGHR